MIRSPARMDCICGKCTILEDRRSIVVVVVVVVLAVALVLVRFPELCWMPSKPGSPQRRCTEPDSVLGVCMRLGIIVNQLGIILNLLGIKQPTE